MRQLWEVRRVQKREVAVVREKEGREMGELWTEGECERGGWKYM